MKRREDKAVHLLRHIAVPILLITLVSACGNVVEPTDEPSILRPLAVESTTGFPITDVVPLAPNGGFAGQHLNDSGLVTYWTSSGGVVYDSATGELTNLNDLVPCPPDGSTGQGPTPRGLTDTGKVLFWCMQAQSIPGVSVGVRSYVLDLANGKVLQELPTPEDGIVQANDINDVGTVIGYTLLRNSDDDRMSRGFLWTPGHQGLTVISPLDSTDSGITSAMAVNSSGWVIGTTGTGVSWTKLMLRNPEGAATLVDIVPRSDVFINDAGEIAGNYFVDPDGNQQRGMFYRSPNGAITHIGMGDVKALSETGLVLAQGLDGPYVWDSRSALRTNIGTLGGERTWVYDIDDAGKVVGESLNSSGQISPFLWDLDTQSMQDLGLPQGAPSTAAGVAHRINDSGQVLGTYSVGFSSWMLIWDIGTASQEPPENTEPTADAGGPYEVIAGNSVTLDGSASSDPDGDTLIFEWDLDGDDEFDDATEPSPVLITDVSDGGSERLVVLRVTDAAGAYSTSAGLVVITTPQDALQVLGADVQSAGLEKKQAKRLLRPLDLAIQMLDTGKIEPACGLLQAFLDQVADAVPDHMDAGTATGLTNGAVEVRSALSCA